MPNTKPPILCFVGRSNSGKTTLIERLIQTLTSSGYRIATIKHAGHGFDLDTEGKDSWRHKCAGAKTVLVQSKTSLAFFSDTANLLPLTSLRDQYVGEVDLVIAEGWKNENYPKIIVVRDHLGEIDIIEDGLLAIVSKQPIESSSPVFHRDDINNIASFIQKHFPRNHST